MLGTNEGHPTYVAIKGTVFDVSANKAYAPKGSYHGMSVIKSSRRLFGGLQTKGLGTGGLAGDL